MYLFQIGCRVTNPYALQFCHFSSWWKIKRGYGSHSLLSIIEARCGNKNKDMQSILENIEKEFNLGKVLCSNHATAETQKESVDGNRMNNGNYEKVYLDRINLTSTQRRRGPRHAIIQNYKEAGSCAFCGVENPVMLCFDHQDRSKKIKTISNMCADGEPILSICEDIPNTGILCQNCHTIKGYIYGEGK